MDAEKTGKIIRALRIKQCLTQSELAQKLHVSDKTVSKWECGAGLPDISLLPCVAQALEVDVNVLMDGEIKLKESDTGNMKKIGFYVCPVCGNILTATGDAQIVCCGHTLEKLTPKPMDEAHELRVEQVEDETFVTCAHEMTKEHYLSFIAAVSYDRVILVRLYPEQNAEVRLPRIPYATIYTYCIKEGLYKKGR